MGSQTWRVKVIHYSSKKQCELITNPYNINRCISVSNQPGDKAESIEIGRFFLIPKFRFMGHGSRIISHLKIIYNKYNTKRLYVMPARSSIPFWKKVGFKPMKSGSMYVCLI